MVWKMRFPTAPEIAIVRKSKAHSGLMRYDSKSDLDWWHAARDILGKEKANYVVMMLGVSDRQNIREKDIAKEPEKKDADKKDGEAAGPTVDRRAGAAAGEENPMASSNSGRDRWEKVYSRRIDETVAALKSKGVPVFWVGLPSIRGTRSTADAVYLNDLYRARAESAGAVYIDVWDGFVDEAGKYTSYGPDYEGQKRRLRSGDGVYFTKYGARKLAHYVEREIRRYMSNRGPIALPSGPMGPVPADGPAARPLAGPVVPLTVTTGNNDELLGGASAASARADATATNVLVKGDAVAAPAGRADDFVWPPGSDANRPAAADKPAPPAKAAPTVDVRIKPAPAAVGAAEARAAKGGVDLGAGRSSRRAGEAGRPSSPIPNRSGAGAGRSPSRAEAEAEAVKPAGSRSRRRMRWRSRNRQQAARSKPGRMPPQHAAAPRPPQPVRRRLRDDGLFGSNGPFGWILGSSDRPTAPLARQVVDPIRNLSTACAHWRPSRIAHTTNDWPRRMSPAANTFGTEVR